MSGKHRILIVEDNPQNAAAMEDIVRSMDFDCRVVATLGDVRPALADYDPCAVLQDMQIPHAATARPHEKAGETSIRQTRERSRGPVRVPIVVVTAYRSDPDFVWEMSELEADEFVMKSAIEGLAGKLARALKKRGRESHVDCARCNVASRPDGDEGSGEVAVDRVPVGRLFAHDKRGATIDAGELRALLDGRAELELFLDCVTDDGRGRLAGYRDHDGVFHETFLGSTGAAILAELVEARRAVRADALKRLRGSGQASAVRQVQVARQAVDVHARVKGKESRTEWRSFHTVGEKGALAFAFEPPAGVRYAVVVGLKGE